jgi:hypothetical protein
LSPFYSYFSIRQGFNFRRQVLPNLFAHRGARHPKEELIQLINALIDNRFIKDFLIKELLLQTIDSQRDQHQQSKEETDPHYKSRPSV